MYRNRIEIWIIGECVLPNLFNFPPYTKPPRREQKEKTKPEAIFSYYNNTRYSNNNNNRPHEMFANIFVRVYLLATTIIGI